MSARASQRSVLKHRYQRFCEAWANEKRYQEYVLGQGEALPDGVNRLGRKPTFSTWLQAVKNKQLAEDGQAAPVQPEPKQVEVQDPDWE